MKKMTFQFCFMCTSYSNLLWANYLEIIVRYIVPLAFGHMNKDVKTFHCKQKAITVTGILPTKHFLSSNGLLQCNISWKVSCKFNGHQFSRPIIKNKEDTLRCEWLPTEIFDATNVPWENLFTLNEHSVKCYIVLYLNKLIFS